MEWKDSSTLVAFIVEETPRNGLSNSLSSPGATSNQFKKELESTNGTLLPTQIPSGTSSIVNLEESAAGDKEVRSNFVYRFFNPLLNSSQGLFLRLRNELTTTFGSNCVGNVIMVISDEGWVWNVSQVG